MKSVDLFATQIDEKKDTQNEVNKGTQNENKKVLTGRNYRCRAIL